VLEKYSECPICRKEVKLLQKNHTLNSIITRYLQNNPEAKGARSDSEAQTMISHEGMTVAELRRKLNKSEKDEKGQKKRQKKKKASQSRSASRERRKKSDSSEEEADSESDSSSV
jgi:hypothetical protein